MPVKPRRSLFEFYVQALRDELRRPSRAILFLVASVVHALANAALALAAGRCAVVLAGSLGQSTTASSSDGIRTAITAGFVGLCAAMAKALGGVVAAHGQGRIAAKVASMLRLEVLDGWFAGYTLRRPRQSCHGQSSTPLFDPAVPPSRATVRGVSALTAKVQEVEVGLSAGLLGGLRALAQLVPLVGALVWLAPKLALIAFGVLAPFALVLGGIRRSWKRAHSQALVDSEHLLEAADDAIRHADLWVAYSAESKARASVSRLGEALARRSARLAAAAAAMSGGNEVLGALALLCALMSAQLGWSGDYGGGGHLLSFTVCFFLAYRPVRDMADARLSWMRATNAFDDLTRASLPGAAISPEPLPSGTTPNWALRDLHVQGLVLAHGTRAPWSFTVDAGTVLVVMGATGQGKTTLLRTLLGLEPSAGGEIRYGSDTLVDAPPGLVHRPFAWVPQDSVLLTDTLEANVTLGGPADVVSGLAALGASRIAATMRDRRLGGGGHAVSGGERQWIALARALATRQPILLLDEPTSGLDADAQDKVLETISNLRGQRSIILVTHRSEPLALADTVVRVEGGRIIVEAPPHSGARAPA